jgi:hypothetical protein
MGLAIDWSREFATCDPEYYKHQQSCSSISIGPVWSIARKPM